MKKIILIAALIITGLSFQVKAQDYYDRGYDDSYNNGGYNNQGFGYFYSSLSPYGSWIEFGDGVYGWRPVHMRMGWAPYANGRWIWTSDGWYWDSYEPYGYIVYHYGRWYYDDYYGWIWIPDYQWAPAWVEWRYDNDYIGWAPLPPYAVFSISVGIHFTHNYYTPYSHWNFVRYNYFCDPYVGKYYVGPKYKNRIYSDSKYRNDYGYRNGRVINRGVDVSLVRERGKVDIRERKITTVSNLRDINDKNRVTNNEIRTFIPQSKNFADTRVKNLKIDRTNRNTSLETSKLEFGRMKSERNQTPVLKNNDTRKSNDVKRTETNNTGRNTSKGTVDQNKRTGDKKVPTDTRIKTNERKDVRTPVYQTPVKKDTRTVDVNRQRTESKVNERIIQKNNEPRKETRINTPPVKQKTEVKTQRTQTRSGSINNTQRQKDNRTSSDQKRITDNSRGRR